MKKDVRKFNRKFEEEREREREMRIRRYTVIKRYRYLLGQEL